MTPPSYRLAPAQEWILTIERLRFARGLQLTKVARLPDGVNDDEAAGCAARLFQRETALRTCVTRRDGAFVQRIMPVAEPPLPRDTADTMTGAVGLLREIMAAEAADPVDPRRQPARVRLFSAGPRLRFLIVTAHHALADWWAMERVASQVGELYQEDGETITFAAYADQLARRSGRSQMRWPEILAGAAASVPPADYAASPTGVTTSKAAVDRVLDAGDLRRMAARARATPFAVLLAAFAVVLRIRTGRDDTLVYTQLANRGRPELTRLVGCLTSTVPLRLDVGDGRSFADLTSEAQRALALAYRYGDIDFGRVMSASGLDASARSTPTPSVLFQMIPPGPPVAWPVPSSLAAVARPGAGLPLDLHVGVSLADGWVRCEADFNDRVYGPGTVTGLLGEFSAVVRRGARQPEEKVSTWVTSRTTRHCENRRAVN